MVTKDNSVVIGRCQAEMGPRQITCYIHHGGAGHRVAARHGEAGLVLVVVGEEVR